MYTTVHFQSNNSVNDSVSTIAAMRHQEDTGYLTTDYLAHQSLPSSSSLCGALCRQQKVPGVPHQLDVTMRGKIVTWYYQVADYCRFRRETVEIALSYLDRFLSQAAASVAARSDSVVFQLAAMTCLYTAVKIHEPQVMSAQLVANLSRKTYSVSEIEAMEVHLLMALQWRLNPPTTVAFAREFLRLIPRHILDEETRDTVYELTRYQAELAVASYSYGLVTVRASTIAYCSLINALQSLGVDSWLVEKITQTISAATGIDGNDDLVLLVSNRLYESLVERPIFQARAQMSRPQRQQKHLGVATSSTSTRRVLVNGSPRSSIVTS